MKHILECIALSSRTIYKLNSITVNIIYCIYVYNLK